MIEWEWEILVGVLEKEKKKKGFRSLPKVPTAIKIDKNWLNINQKKGK